MIILNKITSLVKGKIIDSLNKLIELVRKHSAVFCNSYK